MVRIRPRAGGVEEAPPAAPDLGTSPPAPSPSLPPPPPPPPPPPVLGPAQAPPSGPRRGIYELPEDIWGAGAPPPATPAPGEEPSGPDPAATIFGLPRLAPLQPASGRDVSLSGAGLIMAVVILLTGILAAATGLARDDGDDLATAESTTTSTSTSTSLPAATSTAPSVTAPEGVTDTTAAPPPTAPPVTGRTDVTVRRPGTGGRPPAAPAPPTTQPGVPPADPTPTTAAPPATTSPTIGPNRPMTITIRTEPAEPVAGEPVTITITFRDEDAIPNTNCREISGDDGLYFESETCDEPGCPTNPNIPAQGGVNSVTVQHVYQQAGRYDIRVRGRSGQPECGNPYASRAEQTFTVNVATAP